MNGVEGKLTWPLWQDPISLGIIACLLVLPELVADRPDHAALRARGVTALYRARRIKVGDGANYKLSFSPAARV